MRRRMRQWRWWRLAIRGVFDAYMEEAVR